MSLELFRDPDFEHICNHCCKQYGSFVLVTSDRPYLVADRLNKGWPYQKPPRISDRTPPLAFCDNWLFCYSWNIVGNVRVTETPEFRAAFDRPCVIADIEKRLMKHDNAKYPDLKAKGMSKNGLDCVFCLKRDTYPSIEETLATQEAEYQEVLTKAIIIQVGRIIEALDIGIGQPEIKTKESDGL